MQSLPLLRMRWYSQMLLPPQSLRSLLRRWCSQKADPPQSLHLYLSRWCSQMLLPPQSLHRLRMRTFVLRPWNLCDLAFHMIAGGRLGCSHDRKSRGLWMGDFAFHMIARDTYKYYCQTSISNTGTTGAWNFARRTPLWNV